jgi:hypothetical protein
MGGGQFFKLADEMIRLDGQRMCGYLRSGMAS